MCFGPVSELKSFLYVSVVFRRARRELWVLQKWIPGTQQVGRSQLIISVFSWHTKTFCYKFCFPLSPSFQEIYNCSLFRRLRDGISVVITTQWLSMTTCSLLLFAIYVYQQYFMTASALTVSWTVFNCLTYKICCINKHATSGSIMIPVIFLLYYLFCCWKSVCYNVFSAHEQ